MTCSTLSSGALAALQDFYFERDIREKKFEDLRSASELSRPEAILSMDMFTEDWNASQFWVLEQSLLTWYRIPVDVLSTAMKLPKP